MRPCKDLERDGDSDFRKNVNAQKSEDFISCSSHNDHVCQHVEPLPSIKLPWRDRIKHLTWTWFTMTMATGGLANALRAIPFRFPGLYTIGCVFFIFNIVLFVILCVLMSLRFIFHPQTFKTSFLHPTESLFAPAPLISTCIILVNTSEYGIDYGRAGGDWLVHTMQVLYWLYVAVAFTYSVGIYLLIWNTQVHTIAQMTPVWIFPIYPLLLVAPLASALTRPSSGIVGHNAVQIITGAVVVQGAGFMVSLMIYSAFIYRLMSQKFPKESSRPAMFVSVGPSAFTASGLINIANNLPSNLSPDFMGNGELAGQVIGILGNCVGIWIWGLAIFFFMVSVGAHYNTISRGRIKFANTFWSFIFPNSALCTATIAVAKALDSNKAIEIVACVMIGLLVALWIFIFILMIRAVILKDVLWPETSEDKQADLMQSSQNHQGHSQRPPINLLKKFNISTPKREALKRRFTSHNRLP